MKRIVSLMIALVALSMPQLRADEGMWMINAITKALEAKMQERGCQLSAGEIYNVDAPGAALSDAIVSLDFGCTGSVISDRGLVITNHHCAYGDVFALSSAEHNYLEDGFWAMKSSEEVYIPGKSIYFLKRVLDVTEEVEALKAEELAAGRGAGLRRLSYLIEKKYGEQTGLEASLGSMWSGSRYYLALYEVYSDVRLVAAPPVSIAAFGGDIDNWEWPQHKCDFAMYRIYAGPDGRPAAHSDANVPFKPSRKLAISLDGIREGDFAMVLGYPGRTDRYSSSAKIDYLQAVNLPVANEIRAQQMRIVNDWMNADPSVRLKYADWYFMLSNVQENNDGEVQCIRRFGVVDAKRREEQRLRAWIEADEARKARWGGLLDQLDRTYEAVREPEGNIVCYRETIVRGSKFGLVASRLSSLGNSASRKNRNVSMESIADAYSQMDLRVEKDLFRHCVETFYAGVDSLYWGEYQKNLYRSCGGDAKAAAEQMLAASWMADEKAVTALLTGRDQDGKEGRGLEGWCDDPMMHFLQDVRITAYNDHLFAAENGHPMTDLNRDFTQAMYAMREDLGELQYPDANSTMRLTYGTVGGYEPYDGIWGDWHTTSPGILAKYDPDSYDFNLKSDWKALLENGGRMDVNFLTDNDITGGNSGSPVLNARGEIIGLAFDGNKESLASDVWFTPGYTKCVCVDIRFVVWTLDKYAHMDHILSEIFD